MSSWVSHLPPEVKYSRVVGHGMNAAELQKNKQLDDFFVRDLNQDPDGWALGDQTMDAVVCCVRCAALVGCAERVFPSLDLVSAACYASPCVGCACSVTGSAMEQRGTSWNATTDMRCCSVQYLQQPERVFAEIYRVLKPGGVCIMSFSNRLFYQKAISAWRDGSGYSRSTLVKSYFQAVEGFTQPEAVTEVRARALACLNT